ncbi:MAG: hypothetical protein CSB21_02675 [Deltaproteobacteria bacterium]|nr:MAG: hypothetical protein CSB21_02675 [Deltaproteobacteria bacterium]
MNDFLKSLRAGNDRRRNVNKNYRASHDGNTINYNKDKRNGNDRGLRQNKSNTRDTAIIALRETLEDIQLSINEQLLFSGRIAEAEERQAQALENIADIFEGVMERLEEPLPAEQENTVEADNNQEPVDEDSLLISKEDIDVVKKTSRTYILNLIENLRVKNYTYDEIAVYLTEHDFPTFSGRGKWHAQTIHRLCQEIKKTNKK